MAKKSRNKKKGGFSISNLALIIAPFLFIYSLLFTIKYSFFWPFTRYKRLRAYVWAQAYHETEGFTSNIYRQTSNCFGMKVPKQRDYSAIGTKTFSSGTYLVYFAPGQSLYDLFLYFDAVGFPTSVSNLYEYVDELYQRGYFEDNPQNYYNGMKNALEL